MTKKLSIATIHKAIRETNSIEDACTLLGMCNKDLMVFLTQQNISLDLLKKSLEDCRELLGDRYNEIFSIKVNIKNFTLRELHRLILRKDIHSAKQLSELMGYDRKCILGEIGRRHLGITFNYLKNYVTSEDEGANVFKENYDEDGSNNTTIIGLNSEEIEKIIVFVSETNPQKLTKNILLNALGKKKDNTVSSYLESKSLKLKKLLGSGLTIAKQIDPIINYIRSQYILTEQALFFYDRFSGKSYQLTEDVAQLERLKYHFTLNKDKLSKAELSLITEITGHDLHSLDRVKETKNESKKFWFKISLKDIHLAVAKSVKNLNNEGFFYDPRLILLQLMKMFECTQYEVEYLCYLNAPGLEKNIECLANLTTEQARAKFPNYDKTSYECWRIAKKKPLENLTPKENRENQSLRSKKNNYRVSHNHPRNNGNHPSSISPYLPIPYPQEGHTHSLNHTHSHGHSYPNSRPPSYHGGHVYLRSPNDPSQQSNHSVMRYMPNNYPRSREQQHYFVNNSNRSFYNQLNRVIPPQHNLENSPLPDCLPSYLNTPINRRGDKNYIINPPTSYGYNKRLIFNQAPRDQYRENNGSSLKPTDNGYIYPEEYNPQISKELNPNKRRIEEISSAPQEEKKNNDFPEHKKARVENDLDTDGPIYFGYDKDQDFELNM